MRDFAAIDFETANYDRSSVCSVGVVIVRDGEIVDKFYSLIQPEPNYYNYWCTQVHGLCRADTDDAPVFPDVLSYLSDGLSRVRVPRHACRIPPPATRLRKPSAPDRSRCLRLPDGEPPPCPSRCRSLRLDSQRTAITFTR